MRILVVAAAAGLALGAPVLAPATMMPAALAQFGPTQAQVDALEAEILAAPDQAAVDAIIARESALGNFDLLADSLSEAAVTLAATDLAGAANLVTLAVTASENGSDDAQIQVGVAASTVASTAEDNGDTASADLVETAVSNSTDPDVNTAYIITGGKDGSSVPYTGSTDTGGAQTGCGATPTTGDDDTTTPGDDDTTTTTGDDTTTTTGDDTTTTTGTDTTTTGGDTTTTTTGDTTPTTPTTPTPDTPVAPPPPPNPAQIINPIELVEPPRAQDTDSIV